MKMKHLAGVAAAACALAAVGASAGPSQLDAKLTYNGQTRALDHILVLQYGNEEGLESGPKLRILLSDREIPLGVAGGATSSRAQTYARQAGFTAVLITADPTGRDRGASASLLHTPGMDPRSFVSASSTDAFRALQVTRERASGALSFDNTTMKLAAKFDAPVTANTVTASLTGPAALASPPVKALAAYRAALRKADLETAGKFATAARMKTLRDYRAQAGEQAFRDAVAAAVGDDLAKTVKRLIVRGASASVVLEGKEVDELVQEADGWKVD